MPLLSQLPILPPTLPKHRTSSRFAGRGGLLSGLLAGLVLLLAGPASAHQAHTLITRLSEHGYEVDMSDDGETVVFTSTSDLTGENPGHIRQVFLFQEDRGLLQVTAHAAGTFNTVLELSGDGTKIVVISSGNFAGLGGGAVNELYVGEVSPGDVAWSRVAPDVAFNNGSLAVATDGTAAVATLADLDGTNPNDYNEVFLYRLGIGFTQVTHPDSCAYGQHVQAISGDASRILFAGNCSYGSLNTNRSFQFFSWHETDGIEQLSFGASGHYRSALDGDGDTAAVYSEADLADEGLSETHLYRWTSSTGFERLTTTPIADPGDNGPLSFRRPSISADGLSIAFDSANSQGTVLPNNTTLESFLWRDGSIAALTDSTDGSVSQGQIEPRISGDGKRIAVRSDLGIASPDDTRRGVFWVDIVQMEAPFANMLTNGHFDDDLQDAGWDLDEAAQWTSLDSHSWFDSGSVTGSNLSADPTSSLPALSQCVSVTPEEEYILSAQILVQEGSESGGGEVLVEFYDAPGCVGTPSNSQVLAQHSRAGGYFAARYDVLTTGASTLSLRIAPSVFKTVVGGAVDAWFDDLALRPAHTIPIFDDGFESGDLSAWSASIE